MGKDLKGNQLGTGFSQRKDGRYEARAVINGKKIDIYDLNLQSLKKAFKQAKEDALRENVVERPDVTVSEWFNEWFETCKKPQLKNTNAIRGYRRKFVNRYGAIIGDCKLKDLRQIHIQRATNEMIQNGYNVRNVRDALSVLRQCCDTAMANHIILANPCLGVLLPNDSIMSERRVLEHWEQDLLFEIAEGSYYKEVYHICLLTGMRVGEIGGLEWGDVDFGNQEIYIRRALSVSYDKGKKIEMTSPKTANSVRTIPFFDNVQEYFLSWKSKQDEAKRHMEDRWRNKEFGDLVFTTSLGSPLTKFAFQQDINRVVDDMQARENIIAASEDREPRIVERLYPHAFRHTFATRCFENNLSPIFVQKVMGHSNYATTVSYTHIVDSVKEQEICKTRNFLQVNV